MPNKTIKIPKDIQTTLEKTAHYPQETTNNLLNMHQGIVGALKSDKATPDGKAKENGVMQFSDFQEQALAIEDALDARGIKYTKIIWP
jgi:hypothetical protein